MFTPLFIDGVWNTTFITDLKDFVNKVRKEDTGRIISNIGGYQSNSLNLKDSHLIPLHNHILSETNKFSSTFNFTNNLFKIDNMWININGYKDYNIPHIHTHTLFSGVYYISTPKDCGNIRFLNGHEKTMSYDWVGHFKDYNNYNALQWFLPSEKYKCYIFPSYLTHFVEPNLNSKEERISISFNISLKS